VSDPRRYGFVVAENLDNSVIASAVQVQQEF
jgi:hypothetical protein